MSEPHALRFPVIMTASFVLALFCGTCCADELGRLFTTPEQRSQLEELRHRQSSATSPMPLADDPASAGQVTGNNDVTIQGYVYRKNGRSTVWTSGALMRTHDALDQQLRISTGTSATADVLINFPDGTAAIGARPERTSHPHITE